MAIRTATPLEDIVNTTINSDTGMDGARACRELAEPAVVYPDVSCKCSCATGIPSVGTASMPPDYSENPVRYVNGELYHSQMDLGAGGYGHGWGHTRIYANQLSYAADMGQGPYWLVKEWPYLIQKSDGTVVYTRGVREAIWFTESSGSYTAQFDVKATLTHDAMNDVFKLVMPDGEIFLFHDFDQTSVPKGAFKSHTTVGGQTTSVISFTDGRIEEIQRSVTIDSVTTLESFFYEYDGNNQLQYVTLRRKVDAGSWSNIRRVEYTYYGSSADYGGEGDLQTAERQLHDGMSWVTTGTTYYRYYQDGDANGFAHAIKFIIGPEAYRRLDDAVANPLTATDAQVDDYADHYFEYDESKRVTKEITRGGTNTTLLSYKYSGNAAGPNNWHYKTVETADDGETITVYTNHLGQVLLRELKDGSDSWVNYVQYNSAYRPVLHAHPSAVTSYDDTSADLGLSLKASAGRIDVTTYYSTTSGSGVKDYPEYEKVKKGSTGSEVKLRKYEYTSRTANSITVYPVSKTIVYRNDDGTGDIETSFSYSWHTSSLQMQERVTTLPVISTAQHGSNSANSRTERFDEHGNLIWMKDERGYITRHVYDAVRGVMTQMIQDVDHTQVSDEPSGWTTPAGGGLHLVSDFEYDELGRKTQSLGPAHEIDISGSATSIRRASWIVYDDENHEVRSASGYGSGDGYSTYTLINPVSISKMDQASRVTERFKATRASTSGKLLSTDTFAQSTYVRWSTMSYDDQGNLQWSRVYHDIPSSGAGSSGTNYNQSDFAYSDSGERIMSKTPGGTITRTVFDVRGNAVAVYVGTDDTGATESDPTNSGAGGNNMKLVTENEFDGGNDGGDNDLTEVTQHVDASNTRVTAYTYDFRGRQTDINGEIDFYQINTYDNLGHVTRVDRKNTSSGGTLIARSDKVYDDLGRVYQSIRYAVNPSTGSVGNALTDNIWYDASGKVIKSQPAGRQAFSKTQYDGLGRAVKSFMGFDTDETTYAEANDVTGDTNFEQNENEFDAAGNVIRAIRRRRFHDATGTGELTSPSGSQPKARVSYVTMYPDALGRSQAVANYGTNGGSSHTRATTIPTRSDDILVSETFYDSAGNAWKTVDPASREVHTTFDDLGRTLSTIENYDDGDPTTGSGDSDRTIEYTYNADSQVATITAKQSSGANRLTSLNRGDLNGNHDGLISTTKTFAEAWTLDPVENWTNFKQDTDGDGNWDLNQDRTHNKANEIATISSSSTHIAYDQAGNMIRMPKPASWSSHYDLTFDAWNRLVLVEDGDNSNVLVIYAYDGIDRRTLKNVYVGNSFDHTRHFYYSTSWQILEERLDSAALAERQHVWGLRYIDDLILRDRDADDDSETGELGIANSGLEERLYAMQDPNWNVTAIANTAGDVQERFRFSSYGIVETLGGDFTITSPGHDWSHFFNAAQLDSETLLHQVRHRCRSATLGGWISRDMIGFVDGMNLYSYGQLRPVSVVDSLGLFVANQDLGPWMDKHDKRNDAVLRSMNKEPKTPTRDCIQAYRKCTAKCESDLRRKIPALHIPPLYDALGLRQFCEFTCGMVLEACVLAAISQPTVNRLNADSKECDKYHEDDEYALVRARCMCRCAGSSV